ncbi:MAG: Tn3 family transposase, partial [Yoonia sp.]
QGQGQAEPQSHGHHGGDAVGAAVHEDEEHQQGEKETHGVLEQGGQAYAHTTDHVSPTLITIPGKQKSQHAQGRWQRLKAIGLGRVPKVKRIVPERVKPAGQHPSVALFADRQLSGLSRWHVESEAMARALAIVIEGQSALPMARFWGGGTSASSDGQFFPTTRQGEAMNLINAKYGHEPGLKAYTHVSDQFGPFATQTIPATVNEAPYILDGLLMTDAGQKIREQYADTGGFTDHVFAVTALLGFQFIPRIRDLPSKRLYLFDPASCPKELKGLIGGKVREPVISSNWPDILRSAATMVAGAMPPSQLLRKFASYPRQHELAVALREIGRIERTLFIIDWLLDADMQRRAQIGLNKGEAHHALKNALRIGRQGEIRDRTAQGQHFRMAGLNLLAAIIIYWNTKHLGHAVDSRHSDGLDCSANLLAHISPLGWAHILLTGEYRWPKR